MCECNYTSCSYAVIQTIYLWRRYIFKLMTNNYIQSNINILVSRKLYALSAICWSFLSLQQLIRSWWSAGEWKYAGVETNGFFVGFRQDTRDQAVTCTCILKLNSGTLASARLSCFLVTKRFRVVLRSPKFSISIFSGILVKCHCNWMFSAFSALLENSFC